jgi:hypothetical protein
MSTYPLQRGQARAKYLVICTVGEFPAVRVATVRLPLTARSTRNSHIQNILQSGLALYTSVPQFRRISPCRREPKLCMPPPDWFRGATEGATPAEPECPSASEHLKSNSPAASTPRLMTCQSSHPGRHALMMTRRHCAKSWYGSGPQAWREPISPSNSIQIGRRDSGVHPGSLLYKHSAANARAKNSTRIKRGYYLSHP